jgi:hypothetical protein
MQSYNDPRNKATGWHERLESLMNMEMRAGVEGRPSGAAHGGGGDTWQRPTTG